MRLPQSSIYIANEYVCSRTSAYLTFMMLKIFNVSWGNVFTKNVVSTCSTYAMYLTVNRLVRYTHFYSWCMYTKAALRFFFSLKRFYSALRPYPRQYFHLCSLIFFFYSRTKLNDIYSIYIYIYIYRSGESLRGWATILLLRQDQWKSIKSFLSSCYHDGFPSNTCAKSG